MSVSVETYQRMSANRRMLQNFYIGAAGLICLAVGLSSVKRSAQPSGAASSEENPEFAEESGMPPRLRLDALGRPPLGSVAKGRCSGDELLPA